MTAIYPLCYAQEMHPFLRICIIIFPVVQDTMSLTLSFTLEPGQLQGPQQTQLESKDRFMSLVWKTHQEHTKRLNKNQDQDICWYATCFLGYWKAVALCVSQRHTTAEVACHSWKAYDIPFISLRGILCNAATLTAKYHHRSHTSIKHIALLGYLQLKQPWKG